MPRSGRPVPGSAASVTTYDAYVEFDGLKVVTETFWPGTTRSIASRNSAYERTGVLLTSVITVYASMPTDCAGDPLSVKPTMPTPSWTGVTDAIMTDENRTANVRASSMFVAGPAAYRRARSWRGSARSSSSSGSTNAPMGKMRKISPRERIRIFETRERMPWENSWRMIATDSPKIPYPMGMIGLMPGIPRSKSGDGGFPRTAAVCTRVASQRRRSVVPAIVRATRTIERSPNARQNRVGRARRSISRRPRTVFHMRNGPAGAGDTVRPRGSRSPRRWSAKSRRDQSTMRPAARRRGRRSTMRGSERGSGCISTLSRGHLTRPDVVGKIVVYRERIDLGFRAARLRELFDPLHLEDPIVDAPHLPLLDHDLFLPRRQEACLLKHVEDVAVRDVEVVIDRLRLEPEERHQVVPEGPKILFRHPPLPDRCPEGADHLGHRHNGHSNTFRRTRRAT